MSRTLLVFKDSGKKFRITIPDDSKITFGPFSPPARDNGRGGGGFGSPERAVGTLRIYQGSKENILAVFAGVRGFRDLSVEYEEEIAVEEGATIWKSDQHGYSREEKVSRSSEWVDPLPAIEGPKTTRNGKQKVKP